MKTRKILVGTLVALSVLAIFTAATTAQQRGGRRGQGMMGRRMMGGQDYGPGSKGMMEDMPMRGMMGMMGMGGMMHREIVPIEDGVLVGIGNILFKYDEDLNVVKKTRIEITEEDMSQMMETMQKCFDIRRKMVQEETTEAEE